jgi:HPt (histidine-containing phosphotransfer) domain-containing protein
MDVMMPEMDGLEATRRIRASGAPFDTLPVIGLSANAFRGDADAGRAAGMSRFVTKPIDAVRLIAEIAAALGVVGVLPPDGSQAGGRLQRLRESLGDETAEAVLAAFREDAPRMLRELRVQAAALSVPGVTREAHALAGITGSLGLGALSDAARAIEGGARQLAAMPDGPALDALESGIEAEIRAMDNEPVMSPGKLSASESGCMAMESPPHG